MIPYTKKYIITGAPGTGKTTLTHALERDYPCMHEVSRKVIAGEQATCGNGTPWQDLSRFAQLVYEASIAELKANPQARFTDRSLFDLIAYFQVEGKAIPSNIDRFPYHDHFCKQVFFAPTWREIYRTDEQRLQTFEYCLELEKTLKRTYDEKGFERLLLPKVNPESRRDFVKEAIDSGFNIGEPSLQIRFK